jgi:carboxymethylenebutenolidase
MAGIRIDIPWAGPEPLAGYLSIPACGYGPGLILLPDEPCLDPVIRDTAALFAEEGYVVLALDVVPARGVPAVDAGMKALRGRPQCTGTIGVIGFGSGGLLAFLAAGELLFDAAVIFDPQGLADHDLPAQLLCSVGVHLGGCNGVVSPERIATLGQELHIFGAGDGVVYVYAAAGAGFYLRGRPGYDRSAAQIAHSRVIGLLRRTLGPAYDLEALWEEHIAFEFERRHPEGTMTTMTAEPVNINVPVMTGGAGHAGVLRYYREQFLGQMPADCRVVPVSRTVGTDRLVDEHLLCFTHDRVMDAMLPGVPPTGRAVELAVVVIVEFRGDRVAGEHVHWDQASLLSQVGLLDAKALGLPIGGHANARKLLDERILVEALAVEGQPRRFCRD